MRLNHVFRMGNGGRNGTSGWFRGGIVALVAALIAGQFVYVASTLAVVDGFYVPSDNHPFESVALFDSETTGNAHWPCESDEARRNLSEVGTYVRHLNENTGVSHAVDGRGCQMINSSAGGTTWYGWMYPTTTNGVADFNGGRSGTGDPRHADICQQPNPISMGAGKVRIVGAIEKPATGLSFSASVTLSARPGQCVSEGTLASYTLASIPAQKPGATQAFDITVNIPDGTRGLSLTIRGGETRCTTKGGNCGVYIPSFRIYASQGANAPAPQLPTPLAMPAEQSYGLGNAHGNPLVHYETDPVNTATGNYVYASTDLGLPGRGLDFALTRSYNSLDPRSGRLGPGWRHSYEAALVFESGGDVRFIAEDGAQYVYQPDGSGGYTTPTAARSALTAVGDGTYRITRRDQVTYHFAADGRLLEVADRNANALTLNYTGNLLTSITDTVGRSMLLGYDANERLASLSDPLNRSVTYTYTASGRLATVTDVGNGVWQYGYDGSGRLTTIIDPNNHTLLTNTYGAGGRVSSQTNAANQTGTFQWNAATQTSTYTDARGGVWSDVYRRNVLRSTSDPVGNKTSYVHDAEGNLTSVTDPRGKRTSLTYDAAGNLLTRTAPTPLSYVETWTYTARNDVATYTDGRNSTTTYTYDAAGNLTQLDAPLGATAAYTRDPAGTGLLLSSTDARGKTTNYGYDAQANLTSVSSPLGNLTTISYDAVGRMLSFVDPRGNASGANPVDYTTAYNYDNADRVLTTTDPLGNVTTVAYDAVGNQLTVTDANQRTIGYAYDAANRLTSVTDARSGVTAYTYDAVGNLTTRTDANGHISAYAYDLAGRHTSTTDPLSNVWSLTYDAAGNLVTRTDANGHVITYAHDALNRVTAIGYADLATPDVTLAYDANANLTLMADGAGAEVYAYDDLDRLESVTRGGNAFGYAYDSASHLTSRSYPDATVTTSTFDDDGRMATTVSGGVTTTYGYDAAGNVATVATPDGYTARYAYDRAGRLAEVAHRNATDLLSRFTYTRDAVGNPTAVTTRTGTVSYRYDELNRLTGACWDTTCPWGAGAAPVPCVDCGSAGGLARPADPTPPDPADTFSTWTYDPVGNRLAEATHLGTTTYAYDAADRLTSVTPPGASAIAYTYDANANQVSAGSDTRTWDAADRMISVTAGGATETYTYAGDGRRLSVASGGATTSWWWDLAPPLPMLALERDGSGATVRRSTYGLGRISTSVGSATAYHHGDGLSSVADLTDPAGDPLAWAEYQPFGAVRTSGQVPGAPAVLFGFSGEFTDPSGLLHLRARQYDQSTGRFLSTDPVAPLLTDPYVGTYVYVRNMPTVAVDPSGKFLNIVVGFIAGTVAYGAGTIIGNALQGNDLAEGLNAGDAFISGATGALMAGTAGMGLLVQTSVGGSLGAITSAASMGLGGRRDPTEMAWGTVFGMAGPLADAIPIAALRSLPFREATVGFARGILTSTFLTAGQGVVSMDPYYLASQRQTPRSSKP